MGSSAIKPCTELVFLYGPSGSGKTTVGKTLADHLNLPFYDLDDVIESEVKKSIPEIFKQEGESRFRLYEREAFSSVIRNECGIVGLGGGALLSSGNRTLAEGIGRVIVLTANLENLSSRLKNDNIKRPLLMGDSQGQLRAYLANRAAHYASFADSVDTSQKTPAEVAWEIQQTLGSYHLRGMASPKHPGYDLRIRPEGINFLGEMMRQRGLRGPVVVVTDDHVGEYYLSQVLESLLRTGFETNEVTIPAGENQKTLDTVSQLWDSFLGSRIERGSTIVALGGGVVGDLAGFAAATYLRGVSWVSIPTSLLAMVDAGLGGKTAVDLPQGKNLIGAFHPPRLVVVDPNTLKTLPAVEFTNGMAEVVKHGLIDDPGLLSLCRREISEYTPTELFELLSRAIAVKVKFIEEDPYEQGIRAGLNYGHTVGHGVELASSFKLRHGEAVAIGMVVEARMAEEIGLADERTAEKVARTLQALDLPVKIPSDLNRKIIVKAMMRDKKVAAKQLKFALPAQIGEVRVGVEVEGWESYI